MNQLLESVRRSMGALSPEVTKRLEAFRGELIKVVPNLDNLDPPPEPESEDIENE